MITNFYAWIIKHNEELAVKLLRGEKVVLADVAGRGDVEMSLIIEDRFGNKEDYPQFEFHQKGVYLGSLDTEYGGAPQWPDIPREVEDYSLQDALAPRLEEMFGLSYLTMNKRNQAQRESLQAELETVRQEQVERRLSDSTREELKEQLVDIRYSEMLGDGMEKEYILGEEYILGGVNIVGLDYLTDEELVGEYEVSVVDNPEDDLLAKAKMELEGVL